MWRWAPVVCLEVRVIVLPIRDIPPDLEPGDEPSLRGSMDRAFQATWAFVGLGVLLRVVTFALKFSALGRRSVRGRQLHHTELPGPLATTRLRPDLPASVSVAQSTAVKLFGFSEWSLRRIPTLCSVASVFLFTHMAGRVVRGTAHLLAVGIFAVAYYPIRHGAEVKPYATDLFAALILLALAIEWWRTPKRTAGSGPWWRRPRWRWACRTRQSSWPVE